MSAMRDSPTLLRQGISAADDVPPSRTHLSFMLTLHLRAFSHAGEILDLR